MSVLKKHWRFLTMLVVLCTILFFGFDKVGAMGSQVGNAQKTAQTKLAAHYRLLFDDANKFNGKPATAQGVSLSAQASSLQDVEKRRNAQLRFEVDPRYTLAALPQDSTVSAQINYYQSKRLQLQRDLSFQTNISVNMEANDAFGFAPESAEKLDTTKVANYLAELDMIRVVADSSKIAGVQFVRKFTFLEGGGPQKLAERGLPVRGEGKDSAGNANPAYFQPRALVVTIRASEQALYDFLVELQRPLKGEMRNRFLAIESMKLEKKDVLAPADDLIAADIMVVAYKVNEEVPLPGIGKAAAGADPAATGGPRRFR